MERREDSFYTAYSYGDKLEDGHKLTLEHHTSFDQRHADLSALTWMSLDRLQALRNKSVEAEKTVFRDLQEAAKMLGGAGGADHDTGQGHRVCKNAGGAAQRQPAGGYRLWLAQDQQYGLSDVLSHP